MTEISMFKIIFLSLILIASTFYPASAQNIEYEILGRLIYGIPLVCTVEFADENLNPKKIEMMLDETRNAVLEWEGKLKGTERYPKPEYDFDYWLLGELEKGNTDALLDMTVEQLDEVGNTELLNWAVMFGVIGKRPAELLQYTPTWHHGHAMVLFIPERDKAPSNLKKVSAYDFKNKGFEFYAHPDAAAYKLNKLLYQVRTEAAMRTRVIDDFDGVAARWG